MRHVPSSSMIARRDIRFRPVGHVRRTFGPFHGIPPLRRHHASISLLPRSSSSRAGRVRTQARNGQHHTGRIHFLPPCKIAGFFHAAILRAPAGTLKHCIKVDLSDKDCPRFAGMRSKIPKPFFPFMAGSVPLQTRGAKPAPPFHAFLPPAETFYHRKIIFVFPAMGTLEKSEKPRPVQKRFHLPSLLQKECFHGTVFKRKAVSDA